ncbi:MAG: DNA-binding response regulator [Planctomycetes bacterium]|nr:DNA-binding response regulator [Planctomycetota bacterium]
MNPEQAQAPGMTETTQHQILIVEDETTLAQGVRDALQYGGYNAQIATDGQQALDMIRREKPDLIVLDLMLPSLSGLEILATMRAEGLRSRVVILTALADEEDILRGFQAGADDYLTKPFSPRELVARVEAQFRRVEMDAGPPEMLDLPGDIKVDLARLEVHRDGKLEALTPREADILKYLIRHRDRVVTRGDLLIDVWHYQSANVETRTVDIHIVGLRRKVEPDPANPSLIQTVRGKGYRWHDSD